MLWWSGRVAGALRRGRSHRHVAAAAAGGEQAVGERERRHDDQAEEPRAAAGGGGAEGLQGGRRQGGQEGEGVQDAAGRESLHLYAWFCSSVLGKIEKS